MPSPVTAPLSNGARAASPALGGPEAWLLDWLPLYSAGSLNRFISEAFRLLPRLVPCDYVSAIYQRAGDGFLKERDSLGRVWGPAFMRRYAELTPAVPAVLANPGVKVITTLASLPAPEAELRQTPFYREVMQRQGWRHGVALCFWTDPPQPFPIFVLSLYRGKNRPDFSRRELLALNRIHGYLAVVVLRFHQLSSSNAVTDGIATALRHVASGVMVLDWKMRVVRSNLAGQRSCRVWKRTVPARVASRPTTVAVPADLLEICRELRAQLQTVLRKHPGTAGRCRCDVTDPLMSGLSASITAVCQGAAMAEPVFVIEFEPGSKPPPPATDTRALLSGLTRAERDVAMAVAAGVSNQEAAEQLGKTLDAVKFLLHRVYRKLGVPNRTRLALLFRRNEDPSSARSARA